MAEFTKPSDINKIWAETGTATKPDDTKIALGWVVEAPPHQTENWINKKHDQAIAHVNQMGFFEWDAVTEYRANKSWTLGSNGAIYFCKVTNTNQNPVTDVSETYWRKVLDGNTVLTYPTVSNFVRTTFFPSADAPTARTNLGITTVGSNVITSATQANARTALGAGTAGSNVFVSNSQLDARNAIGVVDADESNKGIVQRANNTEVIAGVDDSKFVTPVKLRSGFFVSLGTNGYIIFPSWLANFSIKWGQNTISSGVSTTVITFPSACLAGTAMNYNIGTGGGDGAMRCAPSGTGLVVTNPESSSRLVGWIAIGY